MFFVHVKGLKVPPSCGGTDGSKRPFILYSRIVSLMMEKRTSYGTHLHLIGVHQAMSMASSGALSGGHALAAPVAATSFHEELTRVIERHSGVKLPAKNRSNLNRVFE